MACNFISFLTVFQLIIIFCKNIFVEPVCRMYNSDFNGYIHVVMTSRSYIRTMGG